MTIELTDEQLDQIFEGFDWNDMFQDWLTEEIIEDWLENNPDFICNYIQNPGYNVEQSLKQYGIEINVVD